MGRRWPEPRLATTDAGIEDRLTGLIWHPESDLAKGAVTWPEALTIAAFLEGHWRLPTINELESLVDCARCDPALAAGHAFGRMGQGYWSSTTSLFEPDWAWALYAETGALGVGQERGRHCHV